MTVPVSACIIAFQEEDRIEDCIASLSFCDEVLVVDSHSTDATRERAAALGARVIERDWPGHVAQKEYAIREAAHDWVLCVDADERVSPELRAAIETERGRGFAGHAGWRMPRSSRWMGRQLRHGSWYPDLQLRLFDRRRGRWAGHDPHDRVELEGPVGRLAGDLLHHPYRSLSEHLQTIDRYTTTMARGALRRGVRPSVFKVFANPAWHFLRTYVLKLGVLDGWRGLAMSCIGAHYVRMKYLKMLEMRDAGAEDGGGPG